MIFKCSSEPNGLTVECHEKGRLENPSFIRRALKWTKLHPSLPVVTDSRCSIMCILCSMSFLSLRASMGVGKPSSSMSESRCLTQRLTPKRFSISELQPMMASVAPACCTISCAMSSPCIDPAALRPLWSLPCSCLSSNLRQDKVSPWIIGCLASFPSIEALAMWMLILSMMEVQPSSKAFSNTCTHCRSPGLTLRAVDTFTWTQGMTTVSMKLCSGSLRTSLWWQRKVELTQFLNCSRLSFITLSKGVGLVL